jgi:hypothetical protein
MHVENMYVWVMEYGRGVGVRELNEKTKNQRVLLKCAHGGVVSLIHSNCKRGANEKLVILKDKLMACVRHQTAVLVKCKRRVALGNVVWTIDKDG